MKHLARALLLCASLIASQALAATATLLGSTADTANSPTTSNAFSPSSGQLLVVFVVGGATVEADPALTSSTGMTFSRVSTTATYSGSTATIYAYVSTSTVSNTSSQTVNFAPADTTNGTMMFVYGVSGMSKTGLTAVRQSAKQDNKGAAQAPTPTFSAAALTGNVVLGVAGNSTNPAALTPPSGWTEPASGDVGYSTPTAGAETAYRNSGETGTVITWGSASASQSGSLILELDTSSSFPATCAGGRTAVGVTSTASAGTVGNLLYGLSPAATANEDTLCVDGTSARGYPVTVDASGWPVVDSGGDNRTDSFTWTINDNGTGEGSAGTYEITTAPTLSNAAGVATGQTTADLGVDVDVLEGTVYACALTKANYDTYGPPSYTQIAAGNGAACAFAANDATPSAEQAFSATGLAAGTVYRFCPGQKNAAATPLTTAGACSSEWSTVTAGDTTPDPYEFTDLVGASINSPIYSNTLAITGLTAPAVVTISGDPSCKVIVNGGAATALETSITNEQTLRLVVEPVGLSGDQVSCSPLVGGVADTSGAWLVRTLPYAGVPRAAQTGSVRPVVRAATQTATQ